LRSINGNTVLKPRARVFMMRFVLPGTTPGRRWGTEVEAIAEARELVAGSTLCFTGTDSYGFASVPAGAVH